MRIPVLCLALTIVSLCPPTSAQWERIVVAYGGSIGGLAVSGTNLFAGTDDGVFLSTNNGASWTSANTPFSGSFTMVQSDTNLFAGAFDDGIFLSTNNGASWRTLYTAPTNTYVYALAVRGANLFFSADDGGVIRVFLSTDNGTSWTAAAAAGLPNTNAPGLLVSGTNLFGWTWDGGVFLSTNNGTSWTQVNAGLTNTMVTALAVSGGNLFAATCGGGVFLSTNNGTSWTPTGVENKGITALAVSGGNLFAATDGGGVFLTTNNGTSWTQVNAGLTYWGMGRLAVSGTNLFAGTSGAGVFLSTNNGTSWSAVNNGLGNIAVTSFDISNTNLFAGTFAGVFRSSDDGRSWGLLNTPFTWFSEMVEIGSNLFAGAFDDVFLSTNNGTSWTATGLTSTRVLAGSGTNLFASTTAGGVFLSTNNGTSWTAVNGGLPRSRYDTTYYEVVAALAASGTNLVAGFSMRQHLGISHGAVYLSSNNGANWSIANYPESARGIMSLVASPEGAGASNFFAGTDGGGVYLSTDNGQEWTEVSAGLPGGTGVHTFAVSPNGLGGTNLFAGTFNEYYPGGVYLSTNNGTSWTAVNSGLPETVVGSLAVSGTNLFAWTNAGVWRRPLSEMVTYAAPAVAELPYDFLLHQNYPNPFNPSTTIRYGLPERSHVTLTIFNSLGQQVAALVQGEQEAGYHETVFDASGLASGVYLYRLQAGDFIQTRKLILIR